MSLWWWLNNKKDKGINVKIKGNEETQKLPQYIQIGEMGGCYK